MTTLSTIVGELLMPLPIATLLICTGLLARAAGRHRPGTIAVAVGGLLAFAAALGPVGSGLLRPLEDRYVGVIDPATLSAKPRYVAVLGSGYRPRQGLPITAALGETAVMRLAEGIRLFRRMPDARLIVSGGGPDGAPPAAQGYAWGAMALGVPRESIIVIDTPLDTRAEIRALRERFGDTPILVVTSAAHMPRAMALSARAGLRAIAAPTDNQTRSGSSWGLSALVPSGASLRKTEIAFHEYLGLLALHFGVT
jgi:uncharacterized SAM-binding protein YcdF (DUF218 family)